MGWDPARIVPVPGDLTKPKLGLSHGAGSRRCRQGQAFLPPGRDLRPQCRRGRASRWPTSTAPARGATGRSDQGRCFHHTSSIAAAGLYPGVFREDMFDEAEDLDHPYFRTKHESEKIVRKECDKIPYRIYRPGMVVGHSKTGEIDKIDGPYYFFTLLKKLRERPAAVDADHRHRGRPHQHGAGRFRGRRDGPHRAQGRARWRGAST
jgi:hypothetical protein